jgi:hypothetical protein
VTQLGAPSQQKGDLLKLLPTLPLRHLPPTLGIGRRFGHAARILLGHLSSPVLLRKLDLKKGDLPGKAFGILVSQGQCHNIFRLHSRYLLLCLPLRQGGPVFYILDKEGIAIPHCGSLLGRSLCSKCSRDVGNLYSGGFLSRSGHLR